MKTFKTLQLVLSIFCIPLYAQQPIAGSDKDGPQICSTWTSNLVGKIVCDTQRTEKFEGDDHEFTVSVTTAESYVYNSIAVKPYTEVSFDFTWFQGTEAQLDKRKEEVDKLREDPEREEAYAHYICWRTFAHKSDVLKKVTLAEDTRLGLWGVAEFLLIPKNSTVTFLILAQGEMTIQGAYSRVNFIEFGSDFEHHLFGKFKKGDMAEVDFQPWPIHNRVSSVAGLSSPWKKF